MSEHASLMQRLVQISGHYRRTQRGDITYVHPHKAIRWVRPEDIHDREWFSHLPDEEFTRSAIETFTSFRALVDKYAQRGGELHEMLAQLLPPDKRNAVPYLARRLYDPQALVASNTLPFTLLFLAPLLPEEERSIVEKTMHTLAMCADNETMLSLYKVVLPYLAYTVPEDMDVLQEASRQQAMIYAALPTPLNLYYTDIASCAKHLVNLWHVFRLADNPDIQRHADGMWTLVQHFSLAGMAQRTMKSFEDSLGSDCGKGLQALCKGFAYLSELTQGTSLNPQEEEAWNRFVRMSGNVAATLTKMCATLAEMAELKEGHRISLGHARETLAILPSVLHKFSERIESEVDKTEDAEKKAPWWVIPRCLTDCLVESAYAHFKGEYDEGDSTSEGCSFLRKVAQTLHDIHWDEWARKMENIIWESDELLPIPDDIPDVEYEISTTIRQHLYGCGYATRYQLEGGAVGAAVEFIEAALAYDVSAYDDGEYHHPSAWHDYVDPFIKGAISECNEILEEVSHSRVPDITEEEVEEAHARLTEIFGGDSYEMEIELPPAYEDRIEMLSKGLARALICLRKATTPEQLPEAIAQWEGEEKQLQEALHSAMASVVEDRIARRTASLGVDDLVRDALLRVFSPAMSDLREKLDELERYRPILQAIMAVGKAAKRGGEVKLPDDLLEAYKQRFSLPKAIELKGKVSDEELERELRKYALSCFSAEGEAKRRRAELLQKLEAAFQAHTKHKKIDYAYFITHYAHSILGIQVSPELTGEERLKAIYNEVRKGLSLQPQPATVRIAWDFDAFRRLGHYGPDPGSCYRDGGIREGDKYRLASLKGTFVATLHVAKGRKKAEERGREHCVARLWGTWDDEVWCLYLTNVHDSGNAIYGEGLRNGTVEIFKRVLGAKVAAQWKRKKHPVISPDLVYQDGDGILYILEANPEEKEER